MRDLYLKGLAYLCKRERLKLSDKYPLDREDMIMWFDLMMIECINQETKAKERFLGISVQAANLLEDKDEQHSITG